MGPRGLEPRTSSLSGMRSNRAELWALSEPGILERPRDVWKVGSIVSPMTDNPALQALAAAGLEHRVVRTERARSAEESAEMQGIPLGALVRTLVVRRGEGDYLFVLVPGDRSISWRSGGLAAPRSKAARTWMPGMARRSAVTRVGARWASARYREC